MAKKPKGPRSRSATILDVWSTGKEFTCKKCGGRLGWVAPDGGLLIDQTRAERLTEYFSRLVAYDEEGLKRRMHEPDVLFDEVTVRCNECDERRRYVHKGNK